MPRPLKPIDSRRWRKVRAIKLRQTPMCERCGEPALIVHHKDQDETNNETDNLESLCNHCHEVEHGRKVETGARHNGFPLDPNHPWNKGGGV